jgi:LytS/YehU family sensor histidine kinase
MLAHLIDYLRATLSASRAGTLPLREEMARVRDYLGLMQIRMGQRLHVSMDVPPDLHEMNVPPMLVQPLVENAIKHGLDPMPDGGALRVTARRDGPVLEIVVRDNGRGLLAEIPLQPTVPPHDERTGAPQGGFGLDCIRARLQTAFGEHASLSLTTLPTQAGTIATLRMPCQDTAP